MTAYTASSLLVFWFVVAFADFGHVDSDFSAYSSRRLTAVEEISLASTSLLNQVKDSAGVAFRIIDGSSTVKPCCVSWGPGRIDCFTRTKTGSVGHWAKQDGVAKEWEDLGGIIVNNIECVSRQEGNIEVLATDESAFLLRKSFDATTRKWTEWIKFEQTLMEAPSCTSRAPSVVECMGRNLSNKPVWFDYQDGSWSFGNGEPVEMKYPCKVHWRTSKVANYWHVSPDGQLWEIYRPSSKWNNWRDLSKKLDSRLTGRPEAVSMNSKRTDALVLSTKNELMHLAWNGRWQPWANLGGSIAYTPSCVAVDASLHCFMVGTDSRLYRRSLEGRKWSEWFDSHGSFIGRPSCVLSDPAKKEISCYLRAFDGTIVEKVYEM